MTQWGTLLVKLMGRLTRMLAALLALALLAVGAVWALLHNEAFTEHALPLLPGVTVVSPQGALLGDFRAARIDVGLPRGGRLTLVEPAWQGARITLEPAAAWHVGLEMASLKARKLQLMWVGSPTSTPSPAAPDLNLPLAVRVQRVQVAEADSSLWGAPFQALDAAVSLQQPDAKGQVLHRLQLKSLSWQGWSAQGEGQLGLGRGLPLALNLQAAQVSSASVSSASDQQPAGRVVLHAQGPVSQLKVQAQLSWQQAPRAAQSLALDAEVAPFAAWPLPRLQASAQALNLNEILADLPQTRLQGRLELLPAAKQDMRLLVDLRNELAGAWDEQRLPVRQVRGQVVLPAARAAGQLAQIGRQGELDVSLLLPSTGRHEDGQLAVQGGWGGQRVLKANWTGLEPQSLHHLAPPLQLRGSLLLKPDWASVDKGRALALADLRSLVQVDVKGWYGHSYLAVPVAAGSSMARLMSKPDVPVSLTLNGRYAPGQFDVATLGLKAESAQADLSNAALRWGPAAGPVAWRVSGRLKVNAFDPQVWLPWPTGVNGRNLLTGQVDVALDANWRGQAALDLAPSWLAGVPLSGQAQWLSPNNRAVMSLKLDMRAGGNSVQATADLPWHPGPQGQPKWGQDAHWQGAVHAPALADLQPMAPLLGARQVSGVIEGSFKGQGVWPALSTDGQVSVSKLQWVSTGGMTTGLAAAQASWAVEGLSVNAPLKVQLDVSQWQMAHVMLDKARWQVTGSLGQHQSRLSADVTHEGSGGKVSAFHVGAAFQGGWQAQASTWQGQVSELLIAMGGESPRQLLQAQPFGISWHEGADARAVQLDGATALNVMGAGLHLRRLSWRTLAGQADAMGEVDVALELDPLNLPALLTSWQPQAGWGGDLMVTGGVQLKHSQRQPWVVDAFVARQSGDITLSEPTIQGNSAQRLGIREARVALQARDGIWSLSEQFEGRVLGELRGRQVVHAASADQLPAPADPLSGELDLQIANLRPWGTWVPAGWRLTGQLQAKAEVGGTLGAPQYRGMVRGQNLGLGQALMGVNLTDGRLQLDLEGEHIKLTELVAQGGAQGGQVSAQGQATLGASPQAQLTVKAERFALLQRVDRRVVISGDAQARFDQEGIDVTGQIQVDEGLIDITRSDAPTVGDDVNVINRPGQDAEEQADASAGNAGPKRKLNANLSVDLGHKLKLRGKGLDAFLAGKLKVATPSNRPAVNGTVHVENGTFAAYGQKLVIERGDVAFTGPVENPRLDILAMRPQSPTAADSDVKVGVNITGTAQDPRIRLYSDPALSETEKLSWLVLGRAPTGLGGADIGLLQSAAVALLSGENSSPSDNLVTMLGLDELSVRQSENATTTARDTVVNLGKQVSKYWYVGYERNLNATSGNWQLIYKLAKRFTVRAQAGDDNAVDFIWSWRWD